MGAYCLNLSPSDEDMREKGIGLYFGTGSLRLFDWEKKERKFRRIYRRYLMSTGQFSVSRSGYVRPERIEGESFLSYISRCKEVRKNSVIVSVCVKGIGK